MATDRLEIDLERFDRWLRRLVDDHPGALVTHRDEPGGAATTVTWPDGGAECRRFDLDPLMLVLIRGGDRRLGTHVLADPRLEALTGLPRRELPDLPDPSAHVLAVALRRARTVWVRFTTSTRPVEHGRRDGG